MPGGEIERTMDQDIVGFAHMNEFDCRIWVLSFS